MEELVMDTAFWNGKRILLTGHTGFKGAWLKFWLQNMGAEVLGLSLPVETGSALYPLLFGEAYTESEICDLRDPLSVTNRVLQAKPDIVFHLAAQSLVRASYRQSALTFETNVQGTVNLLDALRISPTVRAIVVVTTDKVYENREDGRAFAETDALGGHDPYSASKAAAEIISAAYRASFFAPKGIALSTARAGNVIGGGDWAQDRLIPDAIRAWSAEEAITIRSPKSVRPWQHVLEPLSGYLNLAEHMWYDAACAGAYNFGPDPQSAATVENVLQRASLTFGKGEIQIEIPDHNLHEAGQLRLDSSKAARVLGFRSLWSLHETIYRTMNWYRCELEGSKAADLCGVDLAEFVRADAARATDRARAAS
jgi:CDP-glucose 4,6-dehydratase